MANLKSIEQHVKNMNYYSQQIANVVTEQFNEDASKGDINTQAGSIRFDSLGAIVVACTMIDCYCVNMLANLKTVIEQGKKLNLDEEPELEEQEEY